MRLALLVSCSLLVFAKLASAAEAPPAVDVPVEVIPVKEPSHLTKAVRALQLVQDRMATGNDVAVDAQRALLSQMAAKAMASPQPEADMLALALLNGADPAQFGFARRMAETEPLLAGAFAFAEGRQAAAAARLATVDSALVVPPARAQYWLVLGSLLSERDPEAARAALAKARLEAPGTLIEEAALRRETHLRIEDPEHMMSLASAYLRRFGQSPFASAYITQFAASIAAAPPDVQERISVMLDDVLAPARSKDRQGFYTMLARKTLVSGNHQLARMASLRAAAGSDDGPTHLSARLYGAALAIAAQDPGNAAQELHSLMRAPLQSADLEILRAAISIARELRRWPYDPQSNAPMPPTEPTNTEPDMTEAEEESPIMRQATDLIHATDDLVARP